MSWPMSQDFNEAVQNPRIAFTDPDLKTGETVVGAHGMPLPRSGNFADVYQLRGADGREWAVKCFTRPVTGLGDRYAAISEALAEANFPFSVGFEFQAEGILIGGIGRPVVKMEWVEGLLLNQVVRENVNRPGVLAALGQMWAKLCKRLREAGVAHADLQHGNVLLVPGSRPGAFGLKLIDYDGMYVPALANTPSGESGHPSYQHPARSGARAYSQDVDRFPHLVAATALKGLSVCGPALWEKYDNGDNLLFTEDDFRKPTESKVIRELWLTDDPALQAFVGRLAIACGKAIPQTPWLDQLAPDGDPTPLDNESRRAAAAAIGLSLPVLVTNRPPAMPIAESEPEPEPVAFFKPPEPQTVDVELVEEEAAEQKKKKPKRKKSQSAKSESLPTFVSVGVVLLVIGVAVFILTAGGKPKSDTVEQKPEEKTSKELAKKIVPGELSKQKGPDALNRVVPIITLELLDGPIATAFDLPAINGWRRKGYPYHWVIGNASDKPEYLGNPELRLSAHGIAVHPNVSEYVAVSWKSRVAGPVSVAGKVALLDQRPGYAGNAGNGVAWWLEHRTANRATIFAEGYLVLNGKENLPARTRRVEIGDSIILVIDAMNGNEWCDTTEVALTIRETEGRGRVWDLGGDVADTIAEGNPHSDKYGNKDTWSFLRSNR